MEAFLDTPAGPVPRVATSWSRADRWGAARARLGLGREAYKITPGLYAVGAPDDEAPVLVTANYKLSFDHLRRELRGRSAWILVADTHGINVWCAAAKGRFSAAEVALQVDRAGLDRVVRHRRLILPQLAAAGVAAHALRARCGFRGVFGPVRARDLPAYLEEGKAAPTSRQVTFPLSERAVLIPVDLVPSARLTLAVVLLAFALSGVVWPAGFSVHAAWVRGATLLGAVALGLLTGSAGVPLLLPWLPGRAFALKGATLGALVALPLFWALGRSGPGGAAPAGVSSAGLAGAELGAPWLGGAALGLLVVSLASYAGMRFTGSTPFTSLSGVEREMRRALPAQIIAGLAAAGLWVAAGVVG